MPARAPLPAGVPNYVTPRGMTLLRQEAAELEAERVRISADVGDEAERTRRVAVLERRRAELAARIGSATVVDRGAEPPDEIRFGATVTVRTLDGLDAGEERRFTIVGVDEASPADGRVAFLAPIAQAILGRRVGDVTTLRTAQGAQQLEIVAIRY